MGKDHFVVPVDAITSVEPESVLRDPVRLVGPRPYWAPGYTYPPYPGRP